MRIYGWTLVNSDGIGDGTESFTRLFTDKEKAIDDAYNNYVCSLDNYGTDDIDDDVLDEETFKNEINEYNYVVSQYPDFHMQWEIFEQEI